MQIQPFFARFLESQKLPTASTECAKPPAMHTMAYPSDTDFDNCPPVHKFCHNIFKHLGDVLKDPKQAGPETPGQMVTMRYPSDSDTEDGGKMVTMRYPSDSDTEDGGKMVTLRYPSDSDSPDTCRLF